MVDEQVFGEGRLRVKGRGRGTLSSQRNVGHSPALRRSLGSRRKLCQRWYDYRNHLGPSVARNEMVKRRSPLANAGGRTGRTLQKPSRYQPVIGSVPWRTY